MRRGLEIGPGQGERQAVTAIEILAVREDLDFFPDAQRLGKRPDDLRFRPCGNGRVQELIERRNLVEVAPMFLCGPRELVGNGVCKQRPETRDVPFLQS